MSVAENIFLGELPRSKWGFVNWKTLDDRVGTILKRLNADWGPRTRIGSLSLAKQQMCEIARALTHSSQDRRVRRADRLAQRRREDRAL